jgi:Bax protein
MKHILTRAILLTLVAVTVFAACDDESAASQALAAPLETREILVFGSQAETKAWLEAHDWWGGDWQSGPLEVPHVIITGVPRRWQENAGNMPVAQKKEAFFRFMLPLVLHANELVRDRRSQLKAGRESLVKDGRLNETQLKQLRDGAVLIRAATREEVEGITADDPALLDLIDKILYRFDYIPPGLALGQAAYESGWGTSRFAREGNALFGQWTYGGQGIAPKQQRKSLGDHRIAAFEWPFDSVRGYFINLSSHPAYEDFRQLRAQLRAAGEPLDSLRLADGLLRYSERGQDYVDSLKSLIRFNHFDSADHARFRDEPLRFFVSAEDPEHAESLKADIERMRETGELKQIYRRMNLE